MLWREFDRVGEQIPHGLLQAVRITMNLAVGHGGARGRDRDVFGCGGGLQGLDSGRDDRADVHTILVEHKLTRDDAGDVEQVLDQAQLGHRIPFDHGDRIVGAARRRRTTFEHVAPAENRIQRGAQFVRQHGEEFVLGFVRTFGRFARDRQFAGMGFQFVPARLHPLRHRIKGAGQFSEFILTLSEHTTRVVAVFHRLHSAGQFVERFGDAAAERAGGEGRQQHDAQAGQRQDPGQLPGWREHAAAGKRNKQHPRRTGNRRRASDQAGAVCAEKLLAARFAQIDLRWTDDAPKVGPDSARLVADQDRGAVTHQSIHQRGAGLRADRAGKHQVSRPLPGLRRVGRNLGSAACKQRFTLRLQRRNTSRRWWGVGRRQRRGVGVHRHIKYTTAVVIPDRHPAFLRIGRRPLRSGDDGGAGLIGRLTKELRDDRSRGNLAQPCDALLRTLGSLGC